MSEAAQSYDPRRFRTTVPYYARYRLGYPERLIRRVIALTGLEGGDPVLDLGCGPGLLALAFAAAGMAVTGVDPEPAMLEAAKAEAARQGVFLQLRLGSSFDMPDGIGPFGLVAMGRSFHWMDRAATLGMLDRLIAPGGAVALFSDDHPSTAENRWRRVLLEVGGRYGAEDAPHRAARRGAEFRSHESVLLDSAFNQLERVSVVVRRALSADDIVGYAYSTSVMSAEALGARAAAFETELRAALAALAPDGHFTEIAEIGALVARRKE